MEMLFQKQFARKRTPMIRRPNARHANRPIAAKKPNARHANRPIAAKKPFVIGHRPIAAKKPFVIGHRKEVVPTDLYRKPQHVKKPFFVKFR